MKKKEVWIHLSLEDDARLFFSSLTALSPFTKASVKTTILSHPLHVKENSPGLKNGVETTVLPLPLVYMSMTE